MQWFNYSLLFIFVGWTLRVCMAVLIITRQRHVASCLAWLTLVMFNPWIGTLFYGLLGEAKLGARRAKLHERHADRLRQRAAQVSGASVPLPGGDVDDQLLAHVTEGVGGLPLIGGNAVDLFDETLDVIRRLIADIDAATHHVHLLFYIYACDDVGQDVSRALIRAAGRGVKIRLLVDAVGSRRFARHTQDLRSAGVEIGICLPANIFRRGFARIDLRNHRKLVVIDGRLAWTGSQNIVRADYGVKNVGPWRDVMARIQGPSAAQLQAIFIEDWEFSTNVDLSDAMLFPEVPSVGESFLQVVPSGPNYSTRTLQEVVVEAIHSARREVIITTPYFVPDDSLLTALHLAVRRGARVTLVIPKKSNHPLTDYAGQFYFAQLLDAGVNIHLHTQGLLHSKTLSVDDRLGVVGSANFDIRSFYLNFELNVLMYSRSAARHVRNLQQKYLAESRQLTPEEWARTPQLKQFLQDCARLLGPLL